MKEYEVIQIDQTFFMKYLSKPEIYLAEKGHLWKTTASTIHMDEM